MFRVGMPVTGNDFCDRKKHLPFFQACLDNNQHIMIKAPRRYGKTSLVKELFSLNNYEVIYIDIKRAKDLKHLGDLIIDESYKLFGVDGFLQKTKDSIISLLKEIKGKLTIKLQNIAEITLQRLEKKEDIDEVEYFLWALDIVEKLASKENINIKFALDEFQDIILFEKDILDKMRAVIQHHKQITYIFLGSIESIMTKIFSNKSSAFFHFVRVIHLDGLDIDELYDYVGEYFKKERIKFDDGLKDIFVFLEGHPYYCMKFMQILHYDTLINKKISLNKTDYLCAFEETFFDIKSYLEDMVNKLRVKKYHYEVLYNLANKKSQALSADMLYKTFKSLEDMGFIKKLSRANYKIDDKFLELLLNEENEMITNKIIG